MIKVVPYTTEHIKKLKAKDIHDGEVPQVVRTPAVTLIKDDEVIAIFGSLLVCPGVVQIWGLLSEGVKCHPIAFHKTCQGILKCYEEIWKPRRIQIDVKCNYKDGIRWAELLGFKKEGIMKHYSVDGSDSWLLGRTH